MYNAEIKFDKRKIPLLITHILILIVPQIVGMLFLGWNWHELIVLYLLQIVCYLIIDIIIVTFKPKRLVDKAKLLCIGESVFLFSWTSFPVALVSSLMLTYDIQSNNSQIMLAFQQIDYNGIAIVILIFLIASLIASVIINYDKKLSEGDVGEGVGAGLVTCLFSGLLNCFASIGVYNWFKLDYGVWSIFLISQVILEIVRFITPMDRKYKHQQEEPEQFLNTYHY